ncbi:ALK and LTK ligand 2 [Sebastes umbrosus]|uniref:ALK and LTK ligand 2 n=1 Tax=Sebastes umbrosus TaxID=72105 RepID=UPI00189C8511|nr:ALK and LTK ligand 2 [Sebastes umbrosus]XP_037618069.1 ALK and LTK ligand 2 [Sebastes umbrosus]
MLLPRLPVLSALLVLLLAAGRCSVLELVGWSPKTRTETRTETEGLTGPGERRSQPGLEGQPRDPRHKEKFIKHLTGPLYFNPKCRKHFHRLYHNTRDCTIPAYYKRCARLLTRLANSPRCSER